MKRLALRILLLAVLVLPFTTAHAAAECFLFLPGVPGESTDAKYKDQIVVQGWNLAEFQPAGAIGKVQMQEFRFTARTSKASPILFKTCASGAALKNAILTCRQAGAKQQEFLRISLENVRVSSYQAGFPAPSSAPFPPPGYVAGAGDGVPNDLVGLTFGRINVEYLTYLPTGAPGASVVGAFP
jgi:type VI secretion system secreted protein Hcp